MKKQLIAYLLFSFFIVPASFAQTAGEKKGWPSSERAVFITECVKAAAKSMSEDSARLYCYCMQEKVEKKYPTIEAAEKITGEDMQSPEWQKDIKDCLAIPSKWKKEERNGFLSECEKAAADGLGAEKAKSYCACMLFKVEKKFPNPKDADNINEEMLQSPDWKKMIQDCLAF